MVFKLLNNVRHGANAILRRKAAPLGRWKVKAEVYSKSMAIRVIRHLDSMNVIELLANCASIAACPGRFDQGLEFNVLTAHQSVTAVRTKIGRIEMTELRKRAT